MKISEFAERIDVFTTQFEAHIRKHGLEDKIVDMGESEDCREEGKPLCNTPACHGGEIAIMYDELGVLVPTKELCDTSFYESGACSLARQLGLSDDDHLKDCVEYCLEEEWGNRYSYTMFYSSDAFLTAKESDYADSLDDELSEIFYEGVDKNTTLTKILNHWELFSKRIKERALTDDFEIPEEYLLNNT